MASRPIIKIFKLEKVWANKHRQEYKSLLQRDRTFVSFLKFFFLDPSSIFQTWTQWALV